MASNSPPAKIRPGSLLSPRSGHRPFFAAGRHPRFVQLLLAATLMLLVWTLTDMNTLRGHAYNAADEVGRDGQNLLVASMLFLSGAMALLCHQWPHVRVLCGSVTASVFLVRLLQFDEAYPAVLGLAPYLQDQRLFYVVGLVVSLGFIAWGVVPQVSARMRGLLRKEPRATGIPKPLPYQDVFLHWTEILRDGDALERAQAAEAIGSLGPRARGALLPLVRALKDPDERVRAAAASALGRVVTE